MHRCNALSYADKVSDTAPGPGLPAYRAILGHNWHCTRPKHRVSLGQPDQSGSRVTGVPCRVGSRVSVTDPVPVPRYTQ